MLETVRNFLVQTVIKRDTNRALKHLKPGEKLKEFE